MADEPLTIRGINWRETFPFTNLFRAFRVAIHPSKVVLALVALLLLYVGGRVLDGVWPLRDRAVPAEVAAYEAYLRGPHVGVRFDDYHRQPTRRDIEVMYASQLVDLGIEKDTAAADKSARAGDRLGDVKGELLKRRGNAVNDANKSYNDAMAAAGKLSGDARKDAERAAAQTRDATVRSAYENE